MPSSSRACATGPCPCPRLTLSTRISRSSANLSRDAMGSDPGDSTKTSGVIGLESL